MKAYFSGMRILISSNVSKVAADLEKAARRQIPFATAVALTNVAKDAQASVRAGLSKTFTIRNTWASRGIVIRAASKRSFPMQAVVATRDEFMARQSEGGKKTGKGGKRVAIPVAARANKAAVTGRRVWPGALAKKKQFFVVKPASGRASGKQLIYRRDSRTKLTLFYALQKSVDVKPVWKFRETVEATALRMYDRRFGQALAKALATAK